MIDRAEYDRLRQAAYLETRKAVRNGELPKLSISTKCDDCGGVATMYDHRDYRRPLEVDPVCRSCNTKRGPGRPAPEGWYESGQHRANDGIANQHQPDDWFPGLVALPVEVRRNLSESVPPPNTFDDTDLSYCSFSHAYTEMLSGCVDIYNDKHNGWREYFARMEGWPELRRLVEDRT